MAEKTVTEVCVIDAKPETVATAIASPHGLSTWLCDYAQSEKQAEGRLAFRWHDGRQTVGRWTSYDPPTALAWRSRSELDGPEQAVTFALTGEGDGTRVTASVPGLAEGDFEAAAAEWRQFLGDLKLFVETGLSGREVRQPMLGIMPEQIDAESAKKLGVPVEQGMRIGGLVPEGAAGEVGLDKDDVIVKIDAAEVTDWPSLGTALRAHKAGDTVNVHIWRGGEEHDFAVTLKPREMPEVPDTDDAIREAQRGYTTDSVRRIRELFDGVSEAEAEHKPGENEWSAKDVLVHLSLSERFGSDWLIRVVGDGPLMDWPGEGAQLLADALSELPLAELLDRFESDVRDYERLCMAVLEKDMTPWVRRTIGTSPHWSAMHIDDHVGQIKEAIESARA